MAHHYLLANQADTKYYHEDLKLANESVGLVANVKAKPLKPKPLQKTRIQKAEERELTWQHRRMKTTTEKRVSKPNPRFASLKLKRSCFFDIQDEFVSARRRK